MVPQGVYGAVQVRCVSGSLDFDPQDRVGIGDDEEYGGRQTKDKCAIQAVGCIAVELRAAAAAGSHIVWKKRNLPQ